MKRSKGLVLLIFGFCFVHAYPGKPQGDCPFDDYEGVLKKLAELDSEKQHLRTTYASTTDRIHRTTIEKDLHKLLALAEIIKGACKTLPKNDVPTMTAEQRRKFLNEKENLRQKLLIAEGMCGQARDMALAHQQDRKMVRVFQDRLHLATEVRDQIARDYEEFTELRYVSDQKKGQLVPDEKETMAAQDRHSRVLQAMGITLLEGTQPIAVPYQDEINKLRSNIHSKEQVEQTKVRLEALLQTLYEESQFSPATPLRDLENELAEKQKDIIRERDQQHKRRMDLLGELMSKSLAHYTEEEITSLQKANLNVAVMDQELQQVTRQGACLKAISQIADLLNECSDTTRHAADKLPVPEESQTWISHVGLRESALVGGSTAFGHTGQDPRAEVQEIATIIHEKGLLMALLTEQFRNQLNTDIATGLYRVKKKIPFTFLGCNNTELIQIQDRTRKWAANVKYALRLSKNLRKDDKSKNRNKCMGFLLGIWESISSNRDAKFKEDVRLEGDQEVTLSVEEFEKQEDFDFEKHFTYIIENLTLLDIDKQLDEKSLKELRFNFIYVREVADFFKFSSQTIQESCANVTDGNTAALLQSSKSLLKSANTIGNGLRYLFETIKSRVKSNIEVQVRKFQSAWEKNERCWVEIHKDIDERIWVDT